MKKLFFILAAIVLINNACSPRVIYVKGDTTVEYRDSIVVQQDTVSVPVPYEKVVEVVPQMDTLIMETNVAKSVSYLDTTLKMLRGSLTNKGTISVPVENKEEYHSRDSIEIREIPVPVETIKYKTPKWALWSVAFNLLLLILLGTGIYVVLRK